MNKKKVGGYRQGSGRSIHGYYDGIYFASTYELAYYIHETDQGREIVRFTGYIQSQDGSLTYYPDFFVDGEIIEIKGYWTPSVDAKTQLAKDHGYRIRVLYLEDLKHMIEYVKTKQGVKRLEDVYTDNPKEEKECKFCGKVFSGRPKRMRNRVFCGSRCSMLSAKRKGISDETIKTRISQSLERYNREYREKHGENRRRKQPTVKEGRKVEVKRTTTCPYCEKTGGAKAMGRWHFDNCKLKP